jgi:hypothetical protein
VTIAIGAPDWSGTVNPGLGSLVYNNPALAPGGGGLFQIAALPIPALTRTIILKVGGLTPGAFPVNFTVFGNQSGLTYYDGPAYLVSASAATMVIPVAGVADSTLLIEFTVPSAPATVPVQCWADTLQYDESVFYNGTATGSSANASGVLANGPCRLLTANIALESGAVGFISVGGQQILYAYSVAGSFGGASLTMPPLYIVRQGFTVACVDNGVGSNQFNVSVAYP